MATRRQFLSSLSRRSTRHNRLVGHHLVERRARGSYLNHLGMILHARVARYLSQAQAAIDAIGAQKPASGPPVIDRITRTQIRALLAIIQHGSLSGAAHALGLSVGSLQRGTRELEAILQVALLERDAAGLRLNRDGLAFGRRMKLALQEIDRGVAEIEIAKRISGPRIVVGTMPFGSALMLGSVLENIHRLHPQATVRTVTATSAQIVDYLREGEVDLVFGLMPPSHDDTDLVVEAIARTPYAIIVRRDHPLMRLTRVTIDDLRAYGWVVGEAGSHRLESFRQMFRGRDLPCDVITANAPLIVQALLNNSNRLTLATRYELRHMDRRMLCPLSHTPACDEPTFGVMTRTNWLLTSLHVDLIAYARAHMTECQPKACGPANPDRRLSAFATIDARSPSDGAPWASKPSVVPIENVSLRFKG